MERQAVESSAIASIGHDGDTLEVEMKTGNVYRYSGVTREHYDALLGADSVGKHFGQHIRGKFDHTRVEEEKAEDENGARG